MIFDVTCRTGRLQVDETTVRVVSFGKTLWSAPRDSITYIGVTRGAVMADIIVYTVDHHYPARRLTKQEADRFLTLFPGIPTGVPIAPQPPAFVASPAPLPVARRRSPRSAVPGTKKKPPVWAYVVTAIVALVVCSCIGSTVLSAVANNNAHTSNTPPATSTTNAETLATSMTQTSPTPMPTVAPTQPPTPTPVPKPTATPTPRPTPKPTQPPAPKPTPTPSCQAVNGNPWCYNFNSGSLIYNPPSNFCSYFNCISSFWEPDDPGDGYVIQCQDSTYSQSGGERGACSYHGGEARPLYAH